MRLTSIEAREIFSFETLELHDLPTQMLVVVGPNSSGKTNLSRIIEIVLAAVERSATSSQEAYYLLVRFGAARRFEADAASATSVRLSVAFTEEWEVELLLRFVRAAVMASLLRGAPTNIDTSEVLAWGTDISTEMLEPLTRGEIVTELVDAQTGQWGLAYEFEVSGERFRWVLDGVPSGGAIVRAGEQLVTVPNFPLGQKLGIDEQGRVPQRPFALSDLLPSVGEACQLSIDAGSLPATEPLREFAAIAGIALQETQGRSYTFTWVLRVLLHRGIILLGDLRQPPTLDYSVAETGFDPAPTDGSRIPVRLFRWKNGDPTERARFAACQSLFERLTGLTFDVTLALRKDQQRDDESAAVLISPVIRQGGRDLAVEFAGAGIWEALLLSATLCDSGGRVALLDEPARNLHPTLQGRLLQEMRRAPGQVVVTTHSPYLVPVGGDVDVTNIMRFDLHDGATRTKRLTKGSSAEDARMWKVLGESADARSLLFARGVILVEGGTELGALPEWFEKSRTSEKRGAPDTLNVAIFSVDGDLGYETFVRLLNGLGVPWAIVCDGGIFKFTAGKAQIFEQVLTAGVIDPVLSEVVDASASTPSTFAGVRDIGAQHGIFTLATGWDAPAEGFEAYIESVAPEALSEAQSIVGRSKVRKGRHVAAAVDCPEAIDAIYACVLDRLGIKDAG